MPAGMRQKRIVQSNKSTPSLSKRSFAIWSHSLRAYCLLREKTSVKDPERSMEFIGFYIFNWHQGDEIRLKHYPGILLIEFWADLIYNMDTGKAAACVPDHCQHKAKMARPARSACHNLYQIYQVLSLQMSSWSSNQALILWRGLSGPIK